MGGHRQRVVALLIAGRAMAHPEARGAAPDHRFLDIMGDTAGRVALFGIPLQQAWYQENSGELAPHYYLDSDAPLYCCSFTDAAIAVTRGRSTAPGSRCGPWERRQTAPP